MWEGVMGGCRWLRLDGSWPGYTWPSFLAQNWSWALTDRVHGWFDLVFTLPPHLISFHLCERVCDRGGSSVKWVLLCMIFLQGQSMTVAVLTEIHMVCLHLRPSMPCHWLPACLALLSLVPTCYSQQMFLQCMDVVAVTHVCPKVGLVFLNTGQEQVWLFCPLENGRRVHWWINATFLFLPSFSFPLLPPFLLRFLPSSSLFGTTPSVTLGKLRGTPVLSYAPTLGCMVLNGF